SLVDENIENIETIESRVDILESRLDECACSTIFSWLDELDSRVDVLDSLVDICSCESIYSRLDDLDSKVDENIEDIAENRSLIDDLSSKIEICSCESIYSRIDILDSLVDELGSSTGYLQEQIDDLYARIGKSCVTFICTDTHFTKDMLPKEGKVVIYRFDPCCVAGCTSDTFPKFIFDPSIYGADGEITIPDNSKLIFEGEGIIELNDGVKFILSGKATATDCDITFTGCSQIIVRDKALMTVAQDSIVSVTGVGKFVVSNGGSLVLDKSNSQMVFGSSSTDYLKFLVENSGLVLLDNESAYLTFQYGNFVVDFIQSSILDISQGVVEFNTNKGLPAPGKLIALRFTFGSSLIIDKYEEGGVNYAGILSFAPNVDDSTVCFDNTTSTIYGEGHLHFINVDESIDTKVIIQKNYFESFDTVVKTFIQLAAVDDVPRCTDEDDVNSAILARTGSTDPALDNLLAVFAPSMDGSIFLLQEGDHCVYYIQDCKFIIAGIDKNGNFFKIDKDGNRCTLIV
ncbi:hypothetical protein ACFLYU_05685, partial [Candidatus Dependentiae bacterium]